MKTFWVLVVVSALAVVSCGNGAKDPELEAVQKKLQMFELLQKFLSTLFEHGKKTEERNDCLEIGEECFMVTGKNCCGKSNWCNYRDEYDPADPYKIRKQIVRT
uniref:U31-Eretoxin-Ek1m_1 n=1 Tax=Eresus cinnaberinus TaxID=175337 RepID=A0A2D0PCC5_ERECI